MSELFHVDDVCASKSDPTLIGEVDRTHADVDSHEPYPSRTIGEKIHRHKSLSRKAFRQFLDDGIPPRGYVLVQWQTVARTDLLPEKELNLLDRHLMAGDIVKKDAKSTMSGTVVNTRKWCSLRGMFEIQENKSKKRIKASWPPPAEHEPLVELGSEPAPMLYDIPASELQNVLEYHENDLVIYKNWIGRIRDVHDEVTVRLFDNSVVVVHDEVELEPLNSSHDRFTPGDLVKTKKANLRTGRWIYGAYNPNVSPVGVVVYVRTIQAEVDWQQSRIGATNVQDHPGFVLDLDDLESGNVHVYDRTRRPKGYARLAESHEQHIPPVPSEYVSPQTVSFPELEVSPGQRVKFRDLTGACVKYDGSNTHGKLTKQERQDNCGYDMNIFTIASYSTEVVVQWQDCSITTECSTSLVPDAGVDDEDAVYPGELVCTNETTESESWIVRPRKVGVVGSVNAEDRMAAVRWFPHASVAFMKDLGMDLLPESHVGSLPVPTPTNQVSLYDVHAPISLNVRRGDFVFFTQALRHDLKGESSGHICPNTSGCIDWLAEVVDISVQDGSYTLRFGALPEAQDLPRCPQDAKIIALRDHEADEWDNGQDAMSYDYDESDGDDYGSGDSFDDEIGEQWYEYENGVIRAEDEDEDEAWSTESERVENDNDRMDIEPAQPAETFAAPPSETESTVARPGKPASDAPVKATASNSLHPSSLPDAPPSYTILDTAVPSDHHFATTQATTAPRHIKASQKEHKILATSSAIPDGVYVRSYESRMDLFRVLVVGPIDTPYEYAPFVFDIYLPPLYPFEPPQAFFHSWTADGAGMKGRVNPNLYEDGKICLSLLGTWHGDRTRGEGWNPGQSTLLQLLVSLLGLVLVKEPYFNEAGYEALQGLESSRIPSAVYTERTYSRARAFLLHALGSLDRSGSAEGCNGVEDVLKWLYRSETGPVLLDRALEAGQDILTRSDAGGAEEKRDGLRMVSKGACVTLRRVIARLEEMRKAADTQ